MATTRTTGASRCSACPGSGLRRCVRSPPCRSICPSVYASSPLGSNFAAPPDDLLQQLAPVVRLGKATAVPPPWDDPSAFYELTPDVRVWKWLQGIWRGRGTVRPELWRLYFVVIVDGEAVGMQDLTGQEFDSFGTVETTSWVSSDARQRGIIRRSGHMTRITSPTTARTEIDTQRIRSDLPVMAHDHAARPPCRVISTTAFCVTRSWATVSPRWSPKMIARPAG